MSREKKKGTSGNARAYVTRSKALKKLQLSLQEFRRLCIVKGIYPRDPRKKVDGTDKTYYLRKDIEFLAHERLIGTLRAQKAHRKKVVKARAKRQRDVLRSLARSAPKARLDHIVLERYPQFADALRELDDPLCVIALFAHLPANHKFGIAAHRVNMCKRLLNEFHNFVVQTGALRKVFVSIKGYYYQAVVEGEVITWITPHRFTQVLPADVDYTVMLTFLDLYKCILSFVNFKLYTSRNLAYPPKFSRDLLAKGLELGAVEESAAVPKTTVVPAVPASIAVNEPVSKETLSAVAAAAANMDARDDESDEEENAESGDGANTKTGDTDGNDDLDMEEDDDLDRLSVFKGKSVVIGRETPFVELEFVLRAAGASKVTREDDLSDVDSPNRLDGYTHWIVDRPSVRGPRNMSMEYVQPQYIFDSINNGVLLPPSLYGPGAKLPPHLSPFVAEDADGGYRPWFKDVLDRIKAGDESVVAEAAAVVYAQDKAEKESLQEVEKATAEGSTETGDGQVPKKGKKSRRRRSKKGAKRDKETANDQISVVTAVTEEEEASNDNDVADEEEGEADAEANEAEVEESSEEDDDDDDEEMDVQEAKQADEKSDKELAKIMMSRKKMRKYKHVLREEKQGEERKEKLTAKRRAIEMSAQSTVTKKKKKAKRQAK